jgi:hypothetical protein
MNKIKIFLITLVLSFLIPGCAKPPEPANSDIVINELQPVNSVTVTDQNGEYDDWIELYNKSGAEKDISGYYISDNKDNITKWKLPAGTTILGNGFLIIWADGDITQPGLHANFKLSSAGEEVLLSSPDGTLLDRVAFPAVSLEVSYARNPDGTGSFRWQTPTYDKTNILP